MNPWTISPRLFGPLVFFTLLFLGLVFVGRVPLRYIVVNQQLANAQPGDRQRRFIQVRGIVDPARSGKVHGLALHEGGAWFSQAGVQTIESEDGYELAIQAVLGEGIASELGKDLKG